MKDWDLLWDRYGSDETLSVAKALLETEDQTEEAFLGAQGIMMLHGLL